jgi:parallel beta-helix repeat protein
MFKNGNPGPKGERMIIRLRLLAWFASFLVALLVCTLSANAADISGIISATRTIMDDSKLVGDVICTVTGGPCIAFGASGLTLDLNGFSITGLGDPLTGCAGSSAAGEIGIDVNGLKDVVIRGLGLVQLFRNHGIRLNNSTGARVTDVTASTNCLAGIFVPGGTGNVLERNVAIRNGHLISPCGGI